MPSKSSAQHNAMAAAAHGNSDLGIPKKVGQEFIKADRRKATRRTKRRHLIQRRTPNGRR